MNQITNRRPRAHPQPISDMPGIVWPGLAGPTSTTVMALAFQLDRSEWWSPEEIDYRQYRQVSHLVDHAVRTVPYYEATLKTFLSSGGDTISPEQWQTIPLLSREEAQISNTLLHSRDVPKNHGAVMDFHTSGTTGRPIQFRDTTVKQMINLACNHRLHMWQNRDFAGKAAFIRLYEFGKALPPDGERLEGWSSVYATGPAVNLSVASTLSEQAVWLKKEKPQYLNLYPSNLRALIRHCDENSIRLRSLDYVTTFGESVDDQLRADCLRVFSAPIFDTYSALEIGAIAHQCPDHDHYHVQSENVLVEILDDEGRPCEPGAVGKVVLTTLHNFATPLIRYAIGDYAEVGEPCACGRGLPVINKILGRIRNMMSLPNGEKIWPPFAIPALARLFSFRQIQFVQKSLNELAVILVPSRPWTAETEIAFAAEVARRLGHAFEMSYSYVDNIPLPASLKFEDFRSDIGESPAT